MALFQDANIAVVEAAYDKLEVNVVADAITVDMSQPSLVGDGVSLLGSSRAIIAVLPAAGETCDASVFGYFSDVGWRNITELAKTGIDGDVLGDAWKANIGGASRIYVQVHNISGGAVTAHILRSYV